MGAVLCWSTVATAFKLSLNYLSPMQLVLVATATACLFLLLILQVQGRIKALFSQSKQTYLRSFGLGCLNPALYYLVLFQAYNMLPAQEAQVLNYSWAIVMSVLAVPLLGQRFGKEDTIAAVLCYLGVMIIATRGELFSLQFENGTGVLIALLSTVIWSLYWIFSQKEQTEPVLTLTLNFCFALAVLLFYCALTGELNAMPWQGLVGGVYVGLIEMGLGFVLWSSAMKLTKSTARIANLIFISPFLSLIFIGLILREPILPSTLIALVLIVVGLFLQQHLRPRPEP